MLGSSYQFGWFCESRWYIFLVVLFDGTLLKSGFGYVSVLYHQTSYSIFYFIMLGLSCGVGKPHIIPNWICSSHQPRRILLAKATLIPPPFYVEYIEVRTTHMPELNLPSEPLVIRCWWFFPLFWSSCLRAHKMLVKNTQRDHWIHICFHVLWMHDAL